MGIHAIIILREESVLPGARSDHAKRRPVGVTIHKARQEIGNFVACARMPLAGSHSTTRIFAVTRIRSEEHTSELQSRVDLVCRLLLEKKKKTMHSASRMTSVTS